MNVSVQILTYNEAENLPRCLKALEGFDDIWILDSGSNDETVDIAKSAGVQVLVRSFDDFANQRNYGLQNANFKHEWVLHLDADEVVTPELKAELVSLDETLAKDGYFIASRLMLGQRWLRHSGMYPSYQARLGHAKRFYFVQSGHGQREGIPAEKMGHLKHSYLHYNFSHGLKRWFQKHVQYAEDEANQIIRNRIAEHSAQSANVSGSDEVSKRRKLKSLSEKLPSVLRPFARFIYIYILRKGFLDGYAGLQYAFMISVYEGMIAVFLMFEKMNRRASQTEK